MDKIYTIKELQEIKEEKEMFDFLDNFGGSLEESNRYIDSLVEYVQYKCACYKSNKKPHSNPIK